MVYQPSKKEIKQIEKLNRAYKLIKEGVDLIRTNTPNNIRVVCLASLFLLRLEI